MARIAAGRAAPQCAGQPRFCCIVRENHRRHHPRVGVTAMETSNPSGASSGSGTTPLRLVLSAIPAPLTEPVLQGEAAPRAVELSTQRAGSVDGNSRQMLKLAFDIA